MNTIRLLATTAILAALVSTPAAAQAGRFDPELHDVQAGWAIANYHTSDRDERIQAFETLAAQAAALTQKYPGSAEPLVWEGIVLSTFAGVKGGLGALGLARQARGKLEAAEQIDPDALDGSVYTSLGTLYYKLPGWPISFGNDDRALEYLQKALAINPGGIDPNFFYGEFLAENGDREKARQHLQKALQAPARPGRPLADEGRRDEIQSLLRDLDR